MNDIHGYESMLEVSTLVLLYYVVYGPTRMVSYYNIVFVLTPLVLPR